MEAELFARLEGDCADVRIEASRSRQGGIVEDFWVQSIRGAVA